MDGNLVDTVEQYNFLVGIYENVDNKRYKFICGGTIVSNWKIVTAGDLLWNIYLTVDLSTWLFECEHKSIVCSQNPKQVTVCTIKRRLH